MAVLSLARLSGQPFPLAPQPGVAAGSEVLVFVAQHFFNEDEYEPLVRQLQLVGIQVMVTAPESLVAVSMSRENQLVIKPDVALADVRDEDYAGFVLVGGSGMAVHWDDTLLHARCREFAAAGKPLAAIGIAPVTLARAGLLQGRKATVFSERSAIGFLREKGCRYSFRPLVSDRNIITAAGAEHAKGFGRLIAAAVLKK